MHLEMDNTTLLFLCLGLLYLFFLPIIAFQVMRIGRLLKTAAKNGKDLFLVKRRPKFFAFVLAMNLFAMFIQQPVLLTFRMTNYIHNYYV